jgi:hypothetical protein
MVSVEITITIIIGGRTTTGIILIQIKMGITRSIIILITTLKRTITSRLSVAGKWGDRHVDGHITCSSLTLQSDKNQREHGKYIKERCKYF